MKAKAATPVARACGSISVARACSTLWNSMAPIPMPISAGTRALQCDVSTAAPKAAAISHVPASIILASPSRETSNFAMRV
ncbi:hypothetical protein F1189_19095 [Rhodovastum atsumiense]|uniref:Secreted protein n=1 Tax=Rhodovastum atsumiense TaxID=504468 RepID=A0A5M6IQA6_9PROT|nr:hypothetical protein F1189_19095 [Rhodovastum atsumiense]